MTGQHWAILCVVGGCAIVGLMLPAFVYRSVLANARRRLDSALKGEEIVIPPTSANFFGTRSRNGTRLRGNGILALTRRRLVFAMALPPNTLEIPLERIRDAVETTSFNGKSIFRPLLRVAYETDDGSAESAWYLKDVPRWIEALAPARESGKEV